MNMHEAKTRLSSLVRQSGQGKKIVIARDGAPLVRLVPIKAKAAPNRVFGQMKGKIKVESDFTLALNDDELKAVFGEIPA